MAVISDEASTTDEPTVVSLTDYYPFGMEMGGEEVTTLMITVSVTQVTILCLKKMKMARIYMMKKNII